MCDAKKKFTTKYFQQIELSEQNNLKSKYTAKIKYGFGTMAKIEQNRKIF